MGWSNMKKIVVGLDFVREIFNDLAIFFVDFESGEIW